MREMKLFRYNDFVGLQLEEIQVDEDQTILLQYILKL